VKCRICGKEAEFKIKSYNLALCSDCFLRRLYKRVEETIKKYRLFDKGEEIFVLKSEKNSGVLANLLSEMGYKVEMAGSEEEVPGGKMIARGYVLEDVVANALWKILNWELREDVLPSYYKRGRKVVKPLCLLIEEEVSIYRNLRGIEEGREREDKIKEKMKELGILSAGFWLSFYKSLVKDIGLLRD
jgi:DNA-directed RNA polymerase subunit RPC12/RpoP